jgi:hypothetical protein
MMGFWSIVAFRFHKQEDKEANYEQFLTYGLASIYFIFIGYKFH